MRRLTVILLILLSLSCVSAKGQLYQEPMLMHINAATDTVWFPFDPASKGADMALSDGNYTATNTGTCARAFTTNKTTSGLRYFEVTATSAGGVMVVGIIQANVSGNCSASADSTLWAYASSSAFAGRLYYSNTAFITPNNMITFVSGDIIMVAIDYDYGAIYMGVNGTWCNNRYNITGVPTSGSSRTGSLHNFTPGAETYYAYVGNATPNVYNLNTGPNTTFNWLPAGYEGWY